MGRILTAALFFLACALGTSAQATSNAQATALKGDFDPRTFGADVVGTKDSTQALQDTLNAAGKLMGGVVRLHPGVYKISSPISVPNGVILRGSGAFGSYGGTIIKNVGTGPAIRMQSMTGGNAAGSGRFVEISDLVILGSGKGDDCIDLLAGSHISPQMYSISQVSCIGFGGRGIYITATSYGVINQVTLASNSTSGTCLDIEGSPKGPYTEVSYFSRINTQHCSPSLKIVRANNLYFNEMDLNDSSGDGVYISGNSYNLYFTNTNIIRPGTSGIELHASGAHLGRIRFSNTTIQTKGANAAEHYIYAHADPGFSVFNTDFSTLDLARGGRVTLTAGISTDAASCVAFEQVRNGYHDGISIAKPCAFSSLGGFDSSTGVTGPAKAPSGACKETGSWVFSKDGHASFCNGSSWVQKM